MIDERTSRDVKWIPEVESPQLYIYILLNSAGKVKVGKTTNIQQRLNALSGSNGQGIEIIKCWLSPATYLFTLEKIMHNKMSKFRIPNTEWFYADIDPSGERLYSSAVKALKKYMVSDEYERANELRKKYELKEMEKNK